MTPVLLLIPGMLNTGAIWGEVASLLLQHAEVRIAEVHSQSSIAAMARDAWDKVADVHAGTPVLVAGFSMGGYVLMEMLARPARALHAVAFLDTSARPETPEGAAMREKTIAAVQRNFPKVLDTLVPLNLSPASHGRTALMDAIRAMMLEVGAETTVRQMRAVMGRGDHRAVLRELELPALVICGRDDRITPPELSEELAALLPGAGLEWIEGAGHMTLAEQPDRVAHLLETLL